MFLHVVGRYIHSGERLKSMDKTIVWKAVQGVIILGSGYLFFMKDYMRKGAGQWGEYLYKRGKIEKNQRRALMEEIQLLSEAAPDDADSHKLVEEAAKRVFNRM